MESEFFISFFSIDRQYIIIWYTNKTMISSGGLCFLKWTSFNFKANFIFFSIANKKLQVNIKECKILKSPLHNHAAFYESNPSKFAIVFLKCNSNNEKLLNLENSQLIGFNAWVVVSFCPCYWVESSVFLVGRH